MLAKYLSLTVRTLILQPRLTLIKAITLAVGLICSILVLVHVQFAFSVDRHFLDHEKIFRVGTSITTDQGIVDYFTTSDAFQRFLTIDFPQIEHVAQLRPGQAMFTRPGGPTDNEDFFWTGQEAIEVFSLEFVHGNPEAALSEPNAVVLNETAARKYFAETDVVGQILDIRLSGRNISLQITGVIKDLPANTSMDMGLLVSVSTAYPIYSNYFMSDDNWLGLGGTLTYLKVPQEAAEKINTDFSGFIDRYLPANLQTTASNMKLEMSLEPLADTYLSNRVSRDIGSNRSRILMALTVFALLILFSSSLNFASLTLSQIRGREKEVAIRKIFGASRLQIATQFMTECIVMTLLSMTIALPLVAVLLPVYANLANVPISFSTVSSKEYVLVILGFVILAGIMTGLYPALRVSFQKPLDLVGKRGSSGRVSRALRFSMSSIQYGVSIILILLATGISLQISHMTALYPGFDRSNLLLLDTRDYIQTPQSSYPAFLDELARHSGVVAISRSESIPPGTGAYNLWRRPSFAPNESRFVSSNGVDENYMKVYDLKLLAGEFFSREMASGFVRHNVFAQFPPDDREYWAVLTSSGVENFGFESAEQAIGQNLDFTRETFKVVGVVEDFYLRGGLENRERSMTILRATDIPMRYLSIRVDPAQLQSTLAHIEKTWNAFMPEIPLSMVFYDQLYRGLVEEETSGINGATKFAGLVMLIISSLSLYGLSYHHCQRAIKEAGIRKAIGATSASVVCMLIVRFVRPVAFGCVLGTLAASYIIAMFLSGYISPVNFPATAYVFVSLGALLLTIVTVTCECSKAANSKVATVLRYE